MKNTCKFICKRGIALILAWILCFSYIPTEQVQAASITESQVVDKLTGLMKQYPVGTTWSRSFAGGSQCYAFAHFVFDSIFGRGSAQVGNNAVPSNPNCYRLSNVASDINVIGGVEPGYSVGSLETLLEKAKPGDYLQVKRRKSGNPHSMIVVSVDASANRIKIFDANRNGTGKVDQYTLSFQEFYNLNAGCYLYRYKQYNTNSVKPFHIYIDSPKAGAGTTTGIRAEGWAIYGNGVTNVTCNINGNTYNCSRRSRTEVADQNPGYPTGNEGFYYDVPEYLMHPGTNWIIFTAYNGNTVLGSDSRTFQYNMTASKTLSDGLYTIVSAVNDNSVFDINWASQEDEGDLVISNRNGGNNQKFDVTYLGNGYYKIEAHHSKKALDVYNASTERLANVQQCGYHGGMNQKWILRSAGNGYYYIISANNGMYMDLPNADTSPGNSIWMNWGNGSPAEKWKFESTTEKKQTYNLTLINGNGTSMNEYEAGARITLKADAPKSGMRFQKWRIRLGDNTKIDNEYSANTILTMPASSSMVEAIYEKIPTYTVTFNVNGGAISGNSIKTVTSGEKYGTLPTATKSGYTFDGWYTSGSGGTRITENTTVSLAGNQTLYAHWTAKTYTVTFNANGGTISGNSTRTVKYGTKYGTLSTATRSGYTFDGWYTSATGGTKIMENTLVSITGNQTLYAHWSQSTYPLYIYAGGTTSAQFCSVGTTVRIDAGKPADGMKFKRWTAYGADVQFADPNSATTTIVMPNHSVTVEALYEALPKYTVTFDANGGSISGNSSLTVTSGTKYGTLPTASRSGYTFDGWYTTKYGGTKITYNTDVTITADQTLYAHWKQNLFTLSLYTGRNTQTLTYAVGTKVTITADDKPGSGMIFKEWKCYSLDDLEFEDPNSKVTTFIMPARSIMVSAIMQVAPEYTVTFDTMGGKSYGIDESTYIFNMKYGFLPTTKKDGYTFDGWYTAKSGGDKITEDTIVMIDGNHTLYAHWTKSDESMIPPSSETEPSQDENDTETDEEDDESDLGAKFVSGKIRYEVTDEKEAAVIGLKTKQIKKVKIPSVVSYNGRKYNVTEISDYAFRKSSVTEVVIADSVKEIGTSAFLGCKNLAKVTIGINTTKIGTKAFKDCSKLKTIIVKSKKLKRIGKKAFYGISKNAQIKVPAAQYKKYKKLFQGKGQGKKVVLKKYSGK